ncbi:MAG: glycosyltransferase family 39 protein [Candidatus Omnitrophica bacterium]|nr:glycosyltransferase family 39 protein [Candidatus Omnitrophota bacterium]
MLSKRNMILIAIAFIALLHALMFIYVFHYRQPLSADGSWYDTFAWNFANGKGLVGPKGPLILKPPLYPLFLGVLYFFFGHQPMIVLIFQSFIFSGCCVLLFYITRHFFDEKVSLGASLGLALYFPLAYYASGILTEILSIFLTALMVLFWIQYGKTRRKFFLTATGFSLGLLVLCKPIMLLFPAVILMHLFWQGIRGKEWFWGTVLLVMSMVIVLAPWTVRNYLIFREWIPLSKGNMGHNLILATVDQKYDLWHWGFWLDDPEDPRRRELDEIHRKLETAYQQDPSLDLEALYIRETLSRITESPLEYLKGCGVRVLRLWISYPSRSGPAVRETVVIFDSALLVFFIVGLFLTRKQGKDLSVFWFSFIYMTVLHIPFHVEPRYLAPFKPYIFPYIVVALFWLSCFFRSRFCKERPKPNRLKGQRRP